MDICVIYTPNLGLAITVFARGKEHGRFRGSSNEGAKGIIEGAFSDSLYVGYDSLTLQIAIQQ